MADGTAIEWTDATWTPIRALSSRVSGPARFGSFGWYCEHVSEGCRNCYAESLNKRLGTGLPFKPGHRDDVSIFLDEKMLLAPLKWKKPRTIFVCSMTDLFADFVKDEWIDRVFAVMALCPQHRFQVLTKRAKRMREYIEVKRAAAPEWIHLPNAGGKVLLPYEGGWPTNVWLGVSAEDQANADERIPELLATPAAVRFVSLEPLLGPIDLTPWLYALDQAIVGGESGPHARPMHPDWKRSLRDQCAAAGVPFFFKQHGEWVSWREAGASCWSNASKFDRNGHLKGKFLGTLSAGEPLFNGRAFETHSFADGEMCIRVGKKRAGRLLDGVEHNGMPG